ncbi:DUF7601 domain-containing protein [Faecalibaculum rodentium]|uniref:DUF7601 domain-containing protein n=1 Tax=Faecalibaculum rodentium TaxID=1702221 RepID=UPI0023F04885|nr:hypothetical protein [Faecalibaculum rodentium]
MVNKGKKNRMRFFASCLAVAMCLSMVDTSLFFPVNAEGETTPVEQTPEAGQTDPVVETQPEETAPGEGTEPGTEMPEPDVPAVEEEQPEEPANDEAIQPMEPKPEGENNSSEPEEIPIPSVMSVAALEANQDNSGWITRISVLDTEKHVLNPDNIRSLKPGWVRESGIPENQTINGHNYTFKGVEVDGQPVLYTAVYEGEVFYSYDGASGRLLEADKKLDIVYWEYFDVKLNNTGAGTGDFELVTQKLEYPQGTGNTALKSLTDTTLTSIDQNARIYKGMTFNWSVAMHKDAATDSRYVINSIMKNDMLPENAADYKNGGSFSETIDSDTVFKLDLGLNTVVNVMFNSSAVESKNPDPLSFSVGDKTKPIEFSVSTKFGQKIESIYIVTEEGSLEFSTNISSPQKNKGYVVGISSSNFLGKWYTYNISIKKESELPIYDDLVINTDQTSETSTITTFVEDNNTQGAVYNEGDFVSLKTGITETHKLNKFFLWGESRKFFFYRSSPGYTSVPEFFSTSTGYKKEFGILDDCPDKTAAVAAKARGFTHYYYVDKTKTESSTCELSFKSQAIPAKLERIDINGSVLSEVSTDITKSDGFILSVSDLTPPTDGTVFAGYALNEKTDTLYPADSVFTLTADNWSLGEMKDGVQTFTFTPQYYEPDSIYPIYHHRQNDYGEYDAPDESGKYPEGTVEVQTGVSPGTTGYVIGIPKEYEGYTFDAAMSQKTMGIQLVNGKPVDSAKAEIHLYYAKDIQYGNLSIHNHVSGDLANKNKPFSYQLIAKPTSINFPVNELEKHGFTVDSSGTQYVQSVNLKHGDSYSMQNLPITNCEYTVTLTTDDTFYTTTKAVKVNDADVESDGNNKSHVFAANTMTPNATHEVHFTHTASDVVPAGNIFEDKGFDLMLATTAVLGLLCAVYAVFRRRMQIR